MAKASDAKARAGLAKLLGAPSVASDDWSSLVAALIAAGRAIDFADTADGDPVVPPREQVERVVALAGLPASVGAWYDGDKHDDYVTWGIQRSVGKALSAHGRAAIQLDIRDDDRTVTAVVKWADRDRVKALAHAAGGRVISLSPTQPAKPMKPAKPPPAGRKRERVKGWHHSYYRGTSNGIVVGDSGSKPGMWQLDMSTWPPKRRALTELRVSGIGFSRDGGFAVIGSRGDGDDRARVGERSDGIALPEPPDLEVHHVGWLRDWVVICPGEPSYRGKLATGPLVARGKKWVPLDLPPPKIAKGTTKDRFPAFLTHGFARTADEDVLLWERGGYVRRGDKLERIFELGKIEPTRETTNVPDADGFFGVYGEKIYEFRPGAKPVHRLASGGRIDGIAGAPGGAVVARIIRMKSSNPALIAWWPAKREYAKVPAKMFGLRGTDFYDEHGVAQASQLAWAYENLSDSLHAVNWAAIAALPRLPER